MARLNCKQCRKRISLDVLLELRKYTPVDPYCSAECCRADHGVKLTSTGSTTMQYADESYRANHGSIGSYMGVSVAAPTRRQLDARERDRRAREALGVR